MCFPEVDFVLVQITGLGEFIGRVQFRSLKSWAVNKVSSCLFDDSLLKNDDLILMCLIHQTDMKIASMLVYEPSFIFTVHYFHQLYHSDFQKRIENMTTLFFPRGLKR